MKTSRTHTDLAELFFKGGGLLVFFSGLSQINLQYGLTALADVQRPVIGGVIFNVLLYFVLGIVLFSQANLSLLLQRWHLQGLDISPDLVRQWVKYSLVFLGIIGTITFLLPTDYTLGFLVIVGVGLTFLISVPMFILQVGLILVLIMVSWLLNWLGISFLPTNPLGIPTPPAPPSEGNAAPSFWAIFQPILFWAVALVIIGYLTKIYFSEHPRLLEGFKSIKPLDFIAKILTSLWQYWRSWVEAGLQILPDWLNPTKRKSEDAPSLKLRDWLGLRGQTPRDKILYYYLDILQRVDHYQRRFSRRGHQTPYEYEPTLSQAMPEPLTQVHQLTQIFVDARYSQAAFEEAHATTAKQQWQQICNELSKTL